MSFKSMKCFTPAVRVFYMRKIMYICVDTNHGGKRLICDRWKFRFEQQIVRPEWGQIIQVYRYNSHFPFLTEQYSTGCQSTWQDFWNFDEKNPGYSDNPLKMIIFRFAEMSTFSPAQTSNFCSLKCPVNPLKCPTPVYCVSTVNEDSSKLDPAWKQTSNNQTVWLSITEII